MIICMQEKPETVPVSVRLENLTSYYNYTVSVVACTTACSEKSPPVTVQTDIGGRFFYTVLCFQQISLKLFEKEEPWLCNQNKNV